MVRTAIIVLYLPLLVARVHAQAEQPFPRAGLLKFTATICPALLIDAGTTNIHVGGGAEYFAEDRISFKGETFWFLDGQQKDAPLQQNSQLSFGPQFHHMTGRLDLSAGFAPGLSLSRPNTTAEVAAPPLKLLPNVSISGGVTFYVWDYMHFFLNARYVHARYTSMPAGPVALDELVLYGGLGWQFRLKSD
jgi:hypothetical protein